MKCLTIQSDGKGVDDLLECTKSVAARCRTLEAQGYRVKHVMVQSYVVDHKTTEGSNDADK